MKRKLLIYSALGLVALGAARAIHAWLFHPSLMTTNVTLSFLGYTNDTRGLRSGLYRIPDPSDQSMGLFGLANHTKRLFSYHVRAIQVRSEGRWMDDTNFTLPDTTMSLPPVGPTQSVEVAFPVPAGSNTWRCSVGLMDVTYLVRPRWPRDIIIDYLHRAGISFGDKYHVIWSPEIVR